MTALGIRIVVAVILLMIFAVVFSAAWTWMGRCDAARAELVQTRRALKEARNEMEAWREIAEDLAGAIERRAS